MGSSSAAASLPETAIDSSTPIVALRRSFGELQHGVLALARSAGRLGIPAYALHVSGREPATRSRYIRGAFELRAEASDEQLLAALLQSDSGRGRSVLLPIDDASAVFIDDHHHLLAERFVMSKAPAGLYRRLSSKRGLWELCRSLGHSSPASSFPRTEAEARELSGPYGYPVVLKRSAPWLESRDRDAPSVMIAHTGAELGTYYRRMESSAAPNIMLQEYIPGGSETIWIFNGYFGADSECLCAFTGRKLRQRGPHTGPTTLGICEWNETVASAAKRLMAELGYHGIVDMGFRYDERDGQYKLLDVNPRMGSSFRLFVGENGVDVVRAAYLDLTGQCVPPSRARDGRKWLVEPYDLVASAQIRAEGALSLRAWARSLRGVAESAWWARDDVVPFLAMCASLGPEALRYRERRRSVGSSPSPSLNAAVTTHQPVAY